MHHVLFYIAFLPLLAIAIAVPPGLQTRHYNDYSNDGRNFTSEVCRFGSVFNYLNFIPSSKLDGVKSWCANQAATATGAATVDMTSMVTATSFERPTGTFTRTVTKPWTTRTITFRRGGRRPFLAARTAAPAPELKERSFWPFEDGDRNNNNNDDDNNDENDDDDNGRRARVPSYWRDAASSLIPVFCSCLDTPWKTHTANETWTRWHTRTWTTMSTPTDDVTITDAEVTTTVDAGIEATVAITVG
ncbi:hypothetical protein Dda_2125 [Drechslerella dactyloides]|uniref:Uncharacterized protein n=1 Tax=Drechslerella dactyloides TaxID=74499 RepID=A0AAD6NL74_DREDA|nr:hypothetical protein Dda_2125 [Drechslerella dactyloides]